MHKFKVITNQRITPTTLLLTLHNSEPDHPFKYSPGQYAAISFKKRGRPSVVRCFSITSSPVDRGVLQMGIKIKGSYTKHLANLQPGEHINVLGVFGGFTFNPQTHKQVILLAGGIGVTPFISMLRYASRLKLDTNITLLFTSSNQHDVPFADELLELEKQNPNLRIVFVISKGEKDRFLGKRTVSGRISEDMLDKATDYIYPGKTYFICGPTPFMESMYAALTKNGVSEADIVCEAFSSSKLPSSTATKHNWPRLVYGLTSIAVVVGSIIIMGTDFARSMPLTPLPKSTASSLPIPDVSAPANTSQVDNLVNDLPNDAPVLSAKPPVVSSSSTEGR